MNKNYIHTIKRSGLSPLFAISILFFLSPVTEYANAQKPNIIVILADDIGYEVPTCDGGRSYETPNLDLMAAQGMRFTQCHSTPLCTPSRFMLMTGKYNFRNYSDFGIMDTTQKTFGNMFKDAGYKTAIYGKWQLQGGDVSIRIFGFDQYAVHNPLGPQTDGSRYKDPEIYTNGAFLPSYKTKGKYGENIFTDSVLSFMEKNKSNPFFIYYPMVLAHEPFQPTPKDPEFSTWDPLAEPQPGDTIFFPSMVKCMDVKIGAILNKLKTLGIENNTLVIFIGDNGTSGKIHSKFNDEIIKGGKTNTNEIGTHVPMIAYWPGKIMAGSINKDLVDFTDFLPSLASIANIPLPTNYGILDGVNFAPRLTGQPGTPRDWIFCHFNPELVDHSITRWVQDTTYKLYDSTDSDGYQFYNIILNRGEKHPIPDGSLTPAEVIIKQKFLNILDTISAGLPVVATDSVFAISAGTGLASGRLVSNGEYPVTARGFAWDSVDVPGLGNTHTSNVTGTDSFTGFITGLEERVDYNVRAYATSIAGTTYGSKIRFKTLNVIAPVANAASNVLNRKFTANWNAADGAANYQLDVSTSPSFNLLREGFDNGDIPPQGWFISKGISTFTTEANSGLSIPSLKFNNSAQQVITILLDKPATQLQFWIKGLITDAASALLVEGFNGTSWQVIQNITNIPVIETIKIYNASSIPVLPNDLKQFRFTYTKSAGNLAFDDISIDHSSIVPGYDNKIVSNTSQLVTGLSPGTTYYYRVRTTGVNTTSGNSNIVSVTTNSPLPPDPTATAVIPDEASNSIQKEYSLAAQVLPNPSNTEFKLLLTGADTKTAVAIRAINMLGKTIYQTSGSANQTYTFGHNFSPGIYIVEIIQGKLIKTIKIEKKL